DFRVVAMPFSRYYQTGATVWQGGTQAYDVFVHRIDGYAGPVTIAAEKLPAGVTAKSITIGPAARWGTLVLTATADAKMSEGTFTLKATGTDVAGKPTTREVRSAAVIWGLNFQQQQAPVISRLDQSFVLAVRAEKAIYALAPDLAKAVTKVNNKDEKVAAPFAVKQGQKFTVPVKVNWLTGEKQPVQLTPEPIALNAQTSPINVQIPTQPTKDNPEGVANFDVKSNALPGTYYFVLRGTAQVLFTKDPMAKQKGPNIPVEEFSEPIAVTVIPKSVAKVTIANLPNNTLKLGAKGELTVKVERQYDFAGEFQVKVELPKGTAGVTAADVTIPAGKNEAKIELKAAKDAKPAAVNNVVITVTATYDGKHKLTEEAKVTFTIAK
ncbi:MAG TPA: hypothetical protein VLM40_09050, partial [Gemmata sp.]|nr:hypothetical protein [Gemmata sp.]